MKFFIQITIVSIIILTMLGWLQLLAKPCFSGNFGYFLYSPCFHPNEEWTSSHWILRLLLSSIMVWLLVHVFVCYVLETVIYTCLHCLCLTNYQYLFWRKWRQHWNVSGTLRMYKEIQLLSNYYNMIHGGVPSVSLTLSLTSNFIVSLYSVVGLGVSLRERIYFSMAAVDCLIALVIMDGDIKATVHNTSKNILARVRSSPGYGQKRVLSRYLRSWPTIKIKLGSTNFYDRETPLNLVGFCAGQVVNLLLI